MGSGLVELLKEGPVDGNFMGNYYLLGANDKFTSSLNFHSKLSPYGYGNYRRIQWWEEESF